MPASILLISTDAAQQEAVAAVLRPPDYVLATADPEQALREGARHDLLVLDAAGDEAAILELCRRTRAEEGLAAVPLLCIGRTDDVEERMLSGLDPAEAAAQPEAVCRAGRRPRATAPIRRPTRRERCIS